MRALRRFLVRLRTSVAGQRDEMRLAEELEAHLQLQIAENVAAGMAADEARRQAILKFGPIEAIKDSFRDEQRLPLFEDFLLDLRYTLRRLRTAPLFTLTATISLALGIGANAAVFTIVERVLLRRLPVANPHELVYVTDERILTQPSPRFSYPFYRALRENTVLGGVVAYAGFPLSAMVNGRNLRVAGELVSGNYFSVLGAGAAAGRPLTAEDDRTPGAHPVAVISESFWRRTFDSDPAVVGRSVVLNNQAFTVVGVAGNGFAGTDVGRPAEIWIPMAMQREVGRNLLEEGRTNWLEILGRLPARSRREQAAAALTWHLRRHSSELPPQAASRSLILQRGETGRSALRGELRPALIGLMALSGLALALACVNVASLAAIRSAAREKEIAIRLALGVRRSRLQRQLLTEGLVLAALAGLAGVLLAPWAVRTLVAMRSNGPLLDTSLAPRVLLFGALASLVAGVSIALLPILASRRVTLVHSSEANASRHRGSSLWFTPHDLVVTFQIATALSMLISAALLVQSLRSFNSVDPGFRVDNLLIASLDPAAAGYDAKRLDLFWRAALEQVAHVPGVESVSLARTVPLGPGRQRQPWVNPATGDTVEIDTNFVGPHYFQALGIPLAGGREFSPADGSGSRPVVIVNERLAQTFWPQQDPLGKGIRLAEPANIIAEVIGVVRDVKYRDLRGEAGPMAYRAALQTGSSDALTLHVRTAGEPASFAGAIGLAVQTIDRNVPLFAVTTLEEQLDASFAQTRQAALLTGTFGLLALLLSALGVYGVTALTVSRRTRDIGIRIALGAGRLHVIRAVGPRGIVLIASGLGLGLLGALGFARISGTLMFGVTSGDASTFASMTALLALVAILAFSLPIRAATRIDALTAIRHE